MSTNRPKKARQKSGQDGDNTKTDQGDSQAGRRKLEFDHQPLRGKVFYLDLIKYKNSTKLQKDLIALGGKVEEFLGKGIDYVITNRPEGHDLEKRGHKTGTSAQSPSISTPSPFQQGKGSSSKDATDSPCAVSGDRNSTSRGKTIVSRALTSQQFGSRNILTQAIQWGVQVKHLDSILKYIKRERDKLAASDLTDQQKRKSGSERLQSSREELSGAFMKIEDRNSHYRPVSRSLEVWPRVSTDTQVGSCPYDGAAYKGKAQGAERSEDRTEREPQTKKTINKGKALTAGEIRRRKEEKVREKRRGFCECCKQRYDNLDKHLLSTQHREFVSNQNHYSALDKMISQGPDIAGFLDDVMLYHEAQKQAALSSHHDGADICLPTPTDAGQSGSVQGAKPKAMSPAASIPGPSSVNMDTRSKHNPPVQRTRTSEKQIETLRVSLPLEHALPKRFASQAQITSKSQDHDSPQYQNETDLDNSRIEEVYQEIWLGEPALHSASEANIDEFTRRTTNTPKRPITKKSNSKVHTVSSPTVCNQNSNLDKEKHPSHESDLEKEKTILKKNNNCKSSKGNECKQAEPVASLVTPKRSVKRSFDGRPKGKVGDNPCKSKEEITPKENPRKKKKVPTATLR